MIRIYARPMFGAVYKGHYIFSTLHMADKYGCHTEMTVKIPLQKPKVQIKVVG